MKHHVIGIGVTVAAVALAAAFVTAQGAGGDQQAGGPPAVQGQPPVAQGQMGPGRGPGQGQGRGSGVAQPGMPQGERGRGMMAGRGGGMGPRGQGPGAGARDIAGAGPAGLNLTDEQRVRVRELDRASRDQTGPIDDELQFAQRSLHRELFADKRDAAKIGNLTARIATLQKQLADVRVKQATALAEVLTTEQLETMRLRPGRGAGMGRGMSQGRGGPGHAPR